MVTGDPEDCSRQKRAVTDEGLCGDASDVHLEYSPQLVASTPKADLLLRSDFH